MNNQRADTRAAIRTRFHGPTNAKGSRVSATRGVDFNGVTKRVTIPYDYGHGEGNHLAAAQAFLDKHQPGCIVDPRGLCFDNDYFWTWTQGEDAQ
jgi:hypothetical protein